MATSRFGSGNPVRETVVVDTVFGPLEAFQSDHVTKKILAHGAHARSDLAMVLNFIQPGDTVIDIGAHIGSFAIPMANAARPDGRLIAIEANPQTYDILLRNLERHSVEAQTCCNGASNKTGQTLFVQARSCNNSGADKLVSKCGGPPVTTLRVDDLVSSDVQFIKIDVEGMELEVIDSAQCLINRCKPVIYVEYSPSQQKNRRAAAKEFEDFIQAKDYRILLNVGRNKQGPDSFQIGELKDLRNVRRVTNFLLVPRNSRKLPNNVLSPSSREVLSYLTKQKLRHFSGIPKRLFKTIFA